MININSSMQDLLKAQQFEIVNTIKLLIYKEKPTLLEKVDYNDDSVFMEPLLFAYFNSKRENISSLEILEELMQGFFIKTVPTFFNPLHYKNTVVYLPRIGYFRSSESELFEEIAFIKNTNIEILKYPINLLKSSFRNINNEIVYEEAIIIDEDLYIKNINFLTNAFLIIKSNSQEHYELIELYCKKCMMFKCNLKDINSFAAISAHGIAFFNVNQDDYDEVFFIDDIAHQTGHIILTTLFYDKKLIFKINNKQIIGELLQINDYRDFYTLLHALYTYYTTLLCLDDCLKINSFNESQKKEVIGRIGFYQIKCEHDLAKLQEIIIYYGGIENVLTQDGIDVCLLIKNKYSEITNKWNSITSKFNYKNQTYNFSYSIFTQDNNQI
ncbi:hypothetical protein FVB9288_00971 [Flavobacterium sp. CECT 9288]|uniref:hypothetical protein n=1 Tax=Flavobacterium sp. CECT 9288 TaxID=2845819 RepID=UPI001E32A9B3|nr:hypothetical protein [Flavobacterium sp. CECT 9288]CAH0335335.1 hypothetical protein FVB9288_00971 [Flavobacterium sp. CECT 9288]